jgi:hypothetical protein
MTTRGVLYLMPESTWNVGVPFLEHGTAMAKVEVSPGWILGRPRFSNAWSEAHWLEMTTPTEVNEADLADEIRQRVASNQLM